MTFRSLFLGVVVLAACGGPANPADGGDAGMDGHACTGPLSDVRTLLFECPDDYDTTLGPTFGCSGSPPINISAGVSGDLLVARFTYNLQGGTCFYDATTRRLVGELRFDDTTSFCSGTSFEIRAGTVPGSCLGAVPSNCTLTRTDRQTDCLHSPADGGTDGG
ncbi:MAG: hypothetical protein WCJ30_23550 [Deltaproteobacteria bacterium]